MSRAPVALLSIVNAGPERTVDGLCSPFDKGLSYKGGTRPAPMHPGGFAAALGDRCDAGVTLHFAGIQKAFAVFPEGDEKP